VTRFATALVALALLVVPIAGCGADDVNPNALAQAADKTAAVTGMKIDGTMTMDMPGVGKVPMTMTGVADVAGKRMRMETDMSQLAAQSGGEVDADDLKMEAILIDTTMYMHMPVFEEEIGEKWAKVDLQKALEGSGIDLAGMQQIGTSPADQLKFLKETSDLEELGDGHYKGTTDLRKYPGGGDKIAKLAGDPLMPVEVWIGDNGYIERYKMRMTQKVEGQTVKSDTDFRYSDFGTKVEVEAPPADDVKDLTEQTQKGLEEQQGN
jgi:hypothetical protein